MKTTGGVRQEISLSPVLLNQYLINLIMNKLMDGVKRMSGYEMGNKNITNLC